MFGILNVNKPKNKSSFDVIRILKRLRPGKKVKLGYLGTLDPMARGVLPVLIGKTTKLADFLSQNRKSYIGKVKFGISTDTYDITGNVIDSIDDFEMPNIDVIKKTLKKFTGTIEQIPPQVSAKKIDGKRAYALFRKGIKVDMKANKVTVYSIKILEYFEDELILEINCSGGTYIRSIAHDLGIELGIPSTLSALTRTAVGDFNIEDSVEVEDIDSLDTLKKCLTNPANHIELKELVYHDVNRLKNGVFIKKVPGLMEGESIKVMSEEGRLLALYTVKDNVLKPLVMLI